MPPKRPRSMSDDGTSSSRNPGGGTTPDPLASWNDLPAELKTVVLDLACYDRSKEAASACRPMPHLHAKTVLSMSLVSRDVYHCILPIQYRQINITCVSSLYVLHKALLRQPQLGEQIKSLHIGPRAAMPGWWWPVLTTWPKCVKYNADSCEIPPDTYFRSSLDESSLPSGCMDQHFWRADGFDAVSCRALAIYLTILEAQRALDVDMLYHDMSFTGDDIGPAWIARVFECRAALDLYLQHLRHLEETDAELASWRDHPPLCRAYVCEHWPRLVLTGTAVPPRTNATGKTFVLDRSHLLSFLARRDPCTDHFDHPFRFATAGIDGEVTRNDEQCISDVWDDSAVYTVVDDKAKIEDSEAQVSKESLQSPSTPEDDDLKEPPTPASILSWTRAVLSIATSVEGLSLSSYLVQALPEPQKLPRLRQLSLVKTHDSVRSDFTFSDLATAEELCIGGPVLAEQEACCIVRDLPRLQNMTYIVNNLEELNREDGRRLLKVLDILLERNVEIGRVQQASSKEGRSEIVAATDSPSADHRGRSTVVDHDLQPGERNRLSLKVGLNQDAFDKVLRAAPTKECRTAWLAGDEFAGSPHRLKLVELYVANRYRRNEWHYRFRQVKGIYEEGNEWWRRVTTEIFERVAPRQAGEHCGVDCVARAE